MTFRLIIDNKNDNIFIICQYINNKYNMPSKLEAYLQQYKYDANKKSKLPSIYEALCPQKTNKKAQTKQTNSKTPIKNNNLIYSKVSNKQKSFKMISNKIRGLKTQQSSVQDYKRLNKIEQNIMMQIKNIDICLQSQRNNQKQKQKLKTSLFNGFIFLNQVNQLVVQRFHQCLKVQSQASQAIIQGFQIPKFIYNPDGETNIVETQIIKKVSSINKKLLDKSIHTIKNYDHRKDHQYEHNYGKQWSLFKRTNTQVSKSQSHIDNNLTSLNNNSYVNDDSKITFVKSYAKKNQSRSTRLFQSKFTNNNNNSKSTFVNDLSFLNGSRETKRTHMTSVKTEPAQSQLPKQVVVNLTKKDVKLMLSKHKNLISIWLPPASYPQFFGLFTYKILKYQRSQVQPNSTVYKCKIHRYFFYKFGINNKIFDAILQWVIKQSNLPIQSLQITIQKTLYSKLLSKMGWILKFWQSANKVKAIYQRKILEEDGNQI